MKDEINPYQSGQAFGTPPAKRWSESVRALRLSNEDRWDEACGSIQQSMDVAMYMFPPLLFVVLPMALAGYVGGVVINRAVDWPLLLLECVCMSVESALEGER